MMNPHTAQELVEFLKETFNYGPNSIRAWDIRDDKVHLIDYMTDFGRPSKTLSIQPVGDSLYKIEGNVFIGNIEGYDKLVSLIESRTWHSSVKTRKEQEAEQVLKYAKAESKLTDEDRQTIADCAAKINELEVLRNTLKVKRIELLKQLREIENDEAQVCEAIREYANDGFEFCDDLGIRIPEAFCGRM